MLETIVQNSQLLPGFTCRADDAILLRGANLDFMYREQPRSEDDSGWHFQGTQEESSNPSTRHIDFPLQLVLEKHPEILSLLNSPYYSAFERDAKGDLVPHFDEFDEEDRQRIKEAQMLIEVIATAFRDVKLEDGISFHQAKALDDYADSKAARLLDTDTSWTEVDLLKVRYYDATMCFLDAKGLRYYLPAYMIFELKYPRFSNNFGLEFHLYHNEVSSRFSILNREQIIAVRKFLEHREYPISEHWRQFDGE